MKIAIAADLHDNLACLKIFLKEADKAGIEKLIFAGDLTDDDTLGYLSANFGGEIFLVAGNADLYDWTAASKLERVSYAGECLEIEIGGIRIMAAHKPEDLRVFLDKTKTPPAFAFHGHTHKPWIEQIGKTTVANPGTLGGVFYNSSFAILDTETRQLELKVVKLLSRT